MSVYPSIIQPQRNKIPPNGVIIASVRIPLVEYKYKLPENRKIPITKSHPDHNRLAISVLINRMPTIKIPIV